LSDATIVIVDAYGSPTLDADLATFDGAAGLPAPDLRVVEPEGHVVYHSNDPDMLGGAMETTLDVEWAHAIAPGAKIVLVTTPNDNASTVLDALLYAIQHRLGDVISLSWAAPEQDYKASLLSGLHTMFTIAASKHMTVVDATGDTGATGNKQVFPAPFYTYPVALWPATDPDVTAVGGTSLNLDTAGTRLSADTVWNDTYSVAVNKYANQGGSPPSPFASGGGKSVIFTRPSYQGSKTWTVHGYSAHGGYSLAAGVGTIDAAYFVPELARQA
jgi:subtilase family serine protease